jgi:hypothetical protein
VTARPSKEKKPKPASVGARPRAAGAHAKEASHGRVHVAMLVIGFVICGAASLLLGQDNNWDLRNYHYYNPYAFLHDRIGFDVAPAQRQSYLNPFPDLPFYLGATHLSPRFFGFVMGGIHGLGFGLLFAISFVVLRNFGGNSRVGLSALCAGLGAYAPVFVAEVGASENDILIGLLVLTSVFLMVRVLAAQGTLARAPSRRTLLVAALLLGLGAGFKLTVLLHAPAAVAAFLLIERTWRSRAVVVLVWSAAFLAGFLAANGYWMLRLWQEFRNPCFPFYNDIFQSPWAEKRHFADLSMLPDTVWEALARPFIFLYENEYTNRTNEFRDARYALLYVLLVWLAGAWAYRRFLARNRKERRPRPAVPADSRFLLAFFVASFVVWEAKFSILRYATSLEALVPLLFIVVIRQVTSRQGARRTLITVTFVATVVMMRPMKAERVKWEDRFWSVQVPTLPDPNHSMIIMANPRPWAYFVPLFPPGVRWVGINNNLTDGRQVTRMQGEIRKLIDTHEGDIYLLTRAIPDLWLEHDRMVLQYFRLEADETAGQPVLSKHSRPGLFLYPVHRK